MATQGQHCSGGWHGGTSVFLYHANKDNEKKPQYFGNDLFSYLYGTLCEENKIYSQFKIALSKVMFEFLGLCL